MVAIFSFAMDFQPIDLVKLFANHKEKISLDSGDALFKEGESGDLMYVLISGSIDISVKGEVIETVQAGAILGEMAMIEPAGRSASAIAKDMCQLVSINQQKFTFLVQETPFFALHVMKVLADRLRKMNEICNI